MRIPRIYQNCILNTDSEQIQLSESASKHICKVLRMKPGQSIEIFDGKGRAATATLDTIERKRTTVTIAELFILSPRPVVTTHLGQVLSKGDRMDYAIQKSIELGVSEITPLFSDRCDIKLNEDRAQKKLLHWQNIVISSCEQCKQNYLPKVNPAMSLASWSDNLEADLKCMFHTKNASTFANIATSIPNSIAIVVGPEGGFTEEEVIGLLSKDFVTVNLGPRILRTETAPVVALSLIQQLWGDFH